ncbi:MAG: toxin-antitoxin system YwqK family antitoxin, partial [Chlamydiales bacterium]
YYNKGELEGNARYYHPNGGVWKIIPYAKNQIHGMQKIFLPSGEIFQTTEYVNGAKEGHATRYWDISHIAFHEKYIEGSLEEGTYYDREGKVVSGIKNGKGFRAIFGRETLERLEEFQGGKEEGSVRIFDEEGRVVCTYQVKEGEKHGEELSYYDNSEKPKLLLTWNKGVLQGIMKTWYENGNLESQREVSQNQKSGLLTAWYENGALMLVEEYDQDNLLKGEYFRLGEKEPVSKVENGKGVATLFSNDGSFSHKIYYQNGKPLD